MQEKRKFHHFLLLVGILLLVNIIAFPLPAFAEINYSKGQLIYVPVYSHIYFGDQERPFLLTITLSIRNTDMIHPIIIDSIDYYSTEGKLIRKYLTTPQKLNPLTSIRYIVKESDESGGSGAKFIVKWKSEQKVVQPILEGIMISTRGQQGISFTSRGEVIGEDGN